jgi:antitoxin VapB
MASTAKLFRNGRSQAVRLPKEFRFEGTEVRIRKMGESVVLEPVVPSSKASDWKWLDEWRDRFDPKILAGLENQPAPQERPEVDAYFADMDREREEQ